MRPSRSTIELHARGMAVVGTVAFAIALIGAVPWQGKVLVGIAWVLTVRRWWRLYRSP